MGKPKFKTKRKISMSYNLHLKYLERLLESSKDSLKTMKEMVGGTSKNQPIANQGIEKGLDQLSLKEIQNNGNNIKEIFKHITKKENIGFIEKWLNSQINGVKAILKTIESEQKYSTESPSKEEEETVSVTDEPKEEIIVTQTDEEPKEKNNIGSDSKNKEIKYLSEPSESGAFFKHSIKDTKNHNTLYAIEIDESNPNQASIYPINEPRIIDRLNSMPQYLLLPVCELHSTGDIDGSALKITPGVAIKDGDEWRVTKKIILDWSKESKAAKEVETKKEEPAVVQEEPKPKKNTKKKTKTKTEIEVEEAPRVELEAPVVEEPKKKTTSKKKTKK